MHIFLLAVALATAFPAQFYGVDVSVPVSQQQFACLLARNLTFAIARAFHSTGKPDENAIHTVRNAKAAGVHVDAYMFPCPLCSITAEEQVSALAGMINGSNVMISTLWLDIEGQAYWNKDKSANVKFVVALAHAWQRRGWNIGIYCNKHQWNNLLGDFLWPWVGSTPLWWPKYDHSPALSDFEPFGGWSRPNIKQFNDQGRACGVAYDLNFSPRPRG